MPILKAATWVIDWIKFYKETQFAYELYTM